LLAVGFVAFARAENWPAWRGPLGTGISQEKSAPLEWSKDKNIKWQIKLPGPGNSTPIIWEGRVYLTCAAPGGKQRGTYCYDRKTGEEIWKKVVEFSGEEPTHPTNPACSASPVTDGERLVVSHGSAGLFCYDLDGKELWKKDLGKVEHIWGYAASPVIYKDLVIQNVGPGTNSYVIAMNKKTGNEVWRNEYDLMKSAKIDEYRGSWSTPVIYNDGKQDVMLLTLPEKLRAVDPATGEEIWSCSGPSKLFYTSPIIAGDVIVAMCGYGGPAMAARGGGKGDVTDANRLWVHENNPQRVGSGVVVDGKVYLMNEDGLVWCIDAQSGEIHWKERVGGSAWSSGVYAAGRLYFTDMQSRVYVIEPSAESCKVLAKNSLDGKTMRASPAFSNGEIFLRTDEALYCVSEK
jgi:outer membrane protein assembly factor BamB